MTSHKRPLDNAAVQRELAILIEPLVTARKAQGNLTQHRLSKILGVSANSVSEWESGRESLTLTHLIAWARSLKFRVTVMNMLHGDRAHRGRRLRPQRGADGQVPSRL
jgi:transcriptional regulator with XRE-family HTH domain